LIAVFTASGLHWSMYAHHQGLIGSCFVHNIRAS